MTEEWWDICSSQPFPDIPGATVINANTISENCTPDNWGNRSHKSTYGIKLHYSPRSNAICGIEWLIDWCTPAIKISNRHILWSTYSRYCYKTKSKHIKPFRSQGGEVKKFVSLPTIHFFANSKYTFEIWYSSWEDNACCLFSETCVSRTVIHIYKQRIRIK